MDIKISQEDFGILCVCALRYCHGRQTYMPGLVQNIVSSHFRDLTDEDLKVIMADKDFQARFDLWGDVCDRHSWMDFYRKLEGYREGAK